MCGISSYLHQSHIISKEISIAVQVENVACISSASCLARQNSFIFVSIKKKNKELFVYRKSGEDCGAYNCYGKIAVLVEDFEKDERITLNLKEMINLK